MQRILIMSVCLMAASARADVRPQDLPLIAKPFAVLSGQLVMQLPEGGKRDDSSPPGSTRREQSRFVLEKDFDELSITVFDTFAKVDDRYLQAVRADLKTHGYHLRTTTIERLPPGKDLEIYLVTLRESDSDLPFAIAYVRDHDHFVQIVELRLRGRLTPSWRKLARHIVESIAVGQWQVDRAGGVRTLGAPPFAYHLTVPKGWFLELVMAADLVYRVIPPGRLGQPPDWCELQFLDRAPQVVHHEDATTQHGLLLSASVDWETWTEGGVQHTRAVTQSGPDAIVIGCSAASRSRLEELRSAMSTLTIAK